MLYESVMSESEQTKREDLKKKIRPKDIQRTDTTVGVLN